MPRDEAAEMADGFNNAAPIACDDGAEVLGIEPRGELGRSDEVAKQYRKLSPLDRSRIRGFRRRRLCAQFGPAADAELTWGRIYRTAGRTAPHHRRSTLPTKFALRRDFGRATRAVHPDLKGSIATTQCAGARGNRMISVTTPRVPP